MTAPTMIDFTFAPGRRMMPRGCGRCGAGRARHAFEERTGMDGMESPGRVWNSPQRAQRTQRIPIPVMLEVSAAQSIRPSIVRVHPVHLRLRSASSETSETFSVPLAGFVDGNPTADERGECGHRASVF